MLPLDLSSSTNRSSPVEDDSSPSSRNDRPSTFSDRFDRTTNAKNAFFDVSYSSYRDDKRTVSSVRGDEKNNSKNEFFGHNSAPSHRDDKHSIYSSQDDRTKNAKNELFDDFSPSHRDCKYSVSSFRVNETENSNEFFGDFSPSHRDDKRSIPPHQVDETKNPKNDFFGDFSTLSATMSPIQEDNRRGFDEDDLSKNSRQVESVTELSETYDELGMLFSQQMKRQSRPCRRKYCPLARNLRGKNSRIIEHDERKCRSRSRGSFSYSIIKADQRPACSSGNICRDTYDEFELMRATRGQRESLSRAIVERRKYFLDQPCVSPVVTRRFVERPTDIYDQT